MHLRLETWYMVSSEVGKGQGNHSHEHGEEVIQSRPHLQRLPSTPTFSSPQHTAHNFRTTKVVLVDVERTVGGLSSAKLSMIPAVLEHHYKQTSAQKSMTKGPESHHLTHGDRTFRKCEARDFPSGERETERWPSL